MLTNSNATRYAGHGIHQMGNFVPMLSLMSMQHAGNIWQCTSTAQTKITIIIIIIIIITVTIYLLI
jgi:hypothetical protein